MKTFYIAIISLLSMAVFNSCTDGFDTMNTTTTSLTNQSELTPALLFATSVNKGTAANYQRNYSLYDDQYSHYFANCVSGFKTGNYEYNDSWAECGWSEFYTERLKEYYDIVTLCGTKEGYTDMKAMNEIWNCFLWQRVTDRWGDVPYTGASQKTAVAYMSQKDIYLDLLSRLKSACTTIGTSSATQYSPGNYDLLYAGDAAKWKKFGYSLMLRMAMRISNVDATDAATYAKLAIAGGTFTANSDVAKVKCDVGSSGYDYYNYILVDWQNATTDLDFMNYMRGATSGYIRSNTLDPRAAAWFVPGTLGYVGFKNGTAAANYPSTFDWSNYAAINTTSTGYFHYDYSDDSSDRLYYPVMNYAEVLFLKAEAALRGWGGDAESLYTAGITASMNDVSSVSGTTISQSAIDSYIAGLPSFSTASGKEAKLKLIAVQKWLAVFPNSCEGWAEVRRTGYPDDLTYPDVSSSAVVTDGTWIQRISYPNNEYSYNQKNMPTTYQSTSASYSKREGLGVWWSLAGQDKTLSKGYTPTNTFQ
jgi:hypothetical protein